MSTGKITLKLTENLVDTQAVLQSRSAKLNGRLSDSYGVTVRLKTSTPLQSRE